MGAAEAAYAAPELFWGLPTYRGSKY